MSTVTKIVDRPADAPKAPVYPRLVTGKHHKRLYWAVGPGKSKNTFKGVLVHVFAKEYHDNDPVFAQFEKIGHIDDSFSIDDFNDYSGAVTLYNK